MHRRLLAPLLASALAVAGCTGDGDPGPSPTATDAPTAIASPTPTETASPTPVFGEDTLFGTGVVVLGEDEFTVRGDCDVSRGFGAVTVESLEDPDVSILLAVENLTGVGTTVVGPYAFTLQLAGRQVVVRRQAEGGGTETYRGDLAVLELRDRTELTFADAATLHLEATASMRGGDTLEVVADVACVVTRP
jgi:hypothetical protein